MSNATKTQEPTEAPTADTCEPFVETDTTTDADRAREAEYWARMRAIGAAAEEQVAELAARHPEDCPECGSRMEWRAGKPECWSCPECEYWEEADS